MCSTSHVFVHEYVRQSRYPFKTENDDECAAKISDRIQLQHKSYILICERLYAYTFKPPQVITFALVVIFDVC